MGHNCSVVIPTHNRAKLVVRAIASALAAAGPGDEIIVVDDGSTDDTAQRAQQFGESVRYIRQPQRGAGAARNRGLAESRHSLVAFLDSDDEWSPDKLALQKAVMAARPDVRFCFSDFVRQDQGDQPIRRALVTWHRDTRTWEDRLGQGFAYSTIASLPSGRGDFPVFVGDFYVLELHENYIPTFTLMVRKEASPSEPRFPEDLAVYEDWEYFGRLARTGPGALLDCETAVQHGHSAPRLTHASLLSRQSCRDQLLERVWGSDPEFLAMHRDAYQEILSRNRIGMAKTLLTLGRVREALMTVGRARWRYVWRELLEKLGFSRRGRRPQTGNPMPG